MALAEEPLRYMRKYLNVEDELEEESDVVPEPAATQTAPPAKSTGKRVPAKRQPKPLPTDLPSFLKRPYVPTAATKK
jgi:hypothetical protein